MKMNMMMEEVVGRLLNKNGTISVSPFPGRSSWELQRPVPSPPQMGEAKAYNLKMLRDPSPAGGALAGQASPPALSPNLPSIVKMEPRLPSPCNGDPFSPSKRTKQEDGTWLPSPSQMSIDSSVSPPPLVNGHSPTSSYDAYCSSKDKDELSPPNSVMNGCYDYDKKKKGPTPRQQEELCLVCGDRASGYHYNALTCEGCKGFFRRSITKNAVYQCKYGNNCEIDMYMRRKCQECRLKKCLSVGMRPECVVPEYQCAIKRETKKAQKDKDKPNSTTRDSGSDKEEKPMGSPPTNISCQQKAINKAQEELISKLVVLQEEYESPSEYDFKNISDSEKDSMKRFQQITEITILNIQLIVKFSMRVPGFDTILREDQITLLKASSREVDMLRTARKYDMKTDSIVFANNQPFTRENYRSDCMMGDSADSIFHFCRTMCILKVDNAEYALLTAIVIFSERPCLLEPKKVEKIQDFYVETLRCYIAANRPPGKNYFARLLSTLVELHTLGNMNSKLCFSLKVQNKKLPPFLEEIWDIQHQYDSHERPTIPFFTVPAALGVPKEDFPLSHALQRILI